MKILVADDESSILLLALLHLQKLGYIEVVPASDGDEAIAVLSSEIEQQIGLVITDYDMPRVSGEAVLVESKRLCPTRPVIVMSGDFHSDPTREERLISQGADALLEKPFTMETFLSIVQAVLNKNPEDTRKPE